MINLSPSLIADLDDFIASFENSELRNKYFSSNEFIKNTFFEFFQSKTIYTAKDGMDTIGFICYIPNGAFHSFPLIHILTVNPKFRSFGYGKQILDIFEKQYLVNSNKVFLVVANFNPKAKHFYKANGYTQVGKIPNLYKQNIHEYLMMKIINKTV